MINVLTETKGNVFTIDVFGHAEYGEEGKDIVCAAVSAIVHTMCTYAIESNHTRSCMMSEKDGVYMECLVDEYSKETFYGLIRGLEEIQENYPENVSVNTGKAKQTKSKGGEI